MNLICFLLFVLILFFMSSPRIRFASTEIKSKYKLSQQINNEHHRTLSIDSKEKIINDQLKQSMKKCQNIDKIFDELQIPTIKKNQNTISNLISNDRLYRDCVSNIDSEQNVKVYDKKYCNSEEQTEINPIKNNDKGFLSLRFDKIKEQQMIKCKKNGEYNLKKIPRKCCICRKMLNLKDSCQLACTHRIHMNCLARMSDRMKYTCDLCERKKNNRRQINER